MGYKSVVCVATLVCLALVGCNGEGGGVSNVDPSEAYAVVDTVVSVEIDSAAIKLEQQRADSIRIEGLATADEVIEYMRGSSDSIKFEDGILVALAHQDLGYTKRLLQNKCDYFIVADKPSMNVVLFDRFGREQQRYKMACARNYGTKHKRSDCRTPEGFFTVEGIYNSTDWLYTDDNGYTSPTRGVYGPRYIRLVTPVTRTVGIHGTNSPGSLGRRASHGCMRLHNDNILDLVQYAQKGMPVIVNPSDRDQAVNRQEGYDVVQINIGKSKDSSSAANPKNIVPTETVDSRAMPADSVKTIDHSPIGGDTIVAPVTSLLPETSSDSEVDLEL